MTQLRLDKLQPLGRALMLPIAVLPIAGMLLRLGQPDLFNIAFIAAAGDAIFSHLGLLFGIGVAVGLARENHGAAGLAGAVCFLVLTEGVVPYLPNAAVASLADALAAQPHIVYWLTDYFSPLFKKVGGRGGIQKRLAKNAPFLFYPGDDPLDWPRFFAHNGWEVAEMRYSGEEGIKVGRDLPAPPIMRFLMRWTPEERLRPYRRMNGYALLRKGNAVVDIA